MYALKTHTKKILIVLFGFLFCVLKSQKPDFLIDDLKQLNVFFHKYSYITKTS
jgi:hypothetical protein